MANEVLDTINGEKEPLGQRLQRERAEQAARMEAPKKKGFFQSLKDAVVASPEDMQKMTENRADVKNAKQRAIVSNPALTPTETLKARLDGSTDVTGVNEPINHVSMEEAESGKTPEPVKKDGGSVLADAVASGKVDDTFTSGALGGVKDGNSLTTDEKRAAAGLGPENMQVGDKVDGNKTDTGDTGNAGNTAGSSENGLSKQEQIAADSAMKQWQIAQKVLDENNPYKSGADYLQALWGQGAKGKAQAIANVLGNILGATGKGVAGQDYQSDWAKFRDEYTKQSQERRAEAAKNAQDMVNNIAQNKEARAELVNALVQAKAQGANLTQEDMAAINNWQTATTPSSALNKAIASIFQKVSEQGLLSTAGNMVTEGLFGIGKGKK